MFETKHKTNFIDSRPYDLEPFLTKVTDCSTWLSEEIGFRLVNGRIPTYKEEFKKLYQLRGSFSNELYYAFQAMHEMHQVIQIYEHLHAEKSEKFVQTVKKSSKGAAFLDQPNISKTDQARNHLFELLIACDYAAANFQIDLNQRADITLPEKEFIVECKRVNSIPALFERLKSAANQIKNDSSDWPGVIYIDITETTDNPHTILTLNETGALGSFMAMRSDEKTKAYFENLIDTKVGSFIRDSIAHRITTLPEKVVGVVFVANSVGFQASLAYERVVAIQSKFFVPNPISPIQIHDIIEYW